ncbi:coiled-coil domain-containing protein 172 [Caerostris extrusa]|uniref:Coiled-coil domain-containing protein 172 n=1 Tax=Caerostris extrusa TaxID=172846 RepID=A0AAV4Y0J8_CAEEX|nr:coiled-coil domain-containing protein 172 [Caerostris extrusa]
MTENLDDIFNNIYASEQESQEQQEYLANLKNQIKLCEKKLQDIDEKCIQLKEGTAKKMQRLCRREVLLKSLQLRHQLLQDRIRELKLEKHRLHKDLEELKLEFTKMRNEFCVNAWEFDEDYGFSSKGFSNVKGEDEKDNQITKSNDSEMEVQEQHKDSEDIEGIQALLSM